MITNQIEARDRAETTEEITEAALELLLFGVMGYDLSETLEQEERKREIIAKCDAWIKQGYIITGKGRATPLPESF